MNHSPLRLLVLIVLCFGALTACSRSNPPVATLAPTAVVPEQSTGDTTDTGAVAAPTTAVTAVAEAARPSATPAAPAATATPAPTPTPEPSPTPAPPPVYTFEIINTYPHDPTAFTEGLVFFDGTLYEGTGRWGES
ncbi:MAG TPA: glutaminyl-peptide cyclotransferase, partial [Promineifilum sp.]|nr:glutaminyl-peptide cyclotransferase [Promineifilum sp.]